MKKQIYLIAFVILIFCPILLSANDTAKKRLAILPFSSKGNIDSAILDVMFENFTITMVNAGVYSVVEVVQLDKALNELKFQKGDMFDDSSAVKLGKMTGAQIVILPTINYTANSYYVNVKGVDVTTGVATFEKLGQTKNKNELGKIADRLADAISFGDEKNAVSKSNSKSEENTVESKTRQETKKISKADQKFIDKYYDCQWGIDIDDYEANHKKYWTFNGVGIGLAVGGGTLFLAGMITLLATFGYYESLEYPNINNYRINSDYSSYDYDKYQAALDTYDNAKEAFYYVGIPLGIVFMQLGAIMSILSSIPFWYAGRVANIYQKASGEKLTFWQRAKFDTRIVEARNSLTLEIDRKISFDLTISL